MSSTNALVHLSNGEVNCEKFILVILYKGNLKFSVRFTSYVEAVWAYKDAPIEPGLEIKLLAEYKSNNSVERFVMFSKK